ncbi:MAG: hypothetical protein IJZ79_05290 [Bacilli bacterium]|nr:hypothetical protein [Bacilli bacterium]
MNNDVIEELKRLNFEDIIWIIFIILSSLDILADNYQKKYLINNDKYYENIANKIYIIITIITILIYIYFFTRNYNLYQKSSPDQKDNLKIKLLGSIFLLIGGICLLSSQINNNQDNPFIGGPAL